MNREFIDMPQRIAKLPIDKRGFPVPFFATWIDGIPDFRMVRPERVVEAIKFNKCWVCGEKLGSHKAFVIGPMCAITETSADAPVHKECAIFSAKNCPFLANPQAKRNEKGLPGEKMEVGNMIKRNPGVVMVWITKNFKPFKAGDGILFDIGLPTDVMFFSQKRPATKEEVIESIESGECAIKNIAIQDGDLEEYQRRRDKIISLINEKISR
jgi:hypothetical protein